MISGRVSPTREQRKDRASRAQRTAEPATVACINIHDHVGQVQVLQGICDAGAVARSRVLARGKVAVGDQVWQGVGLNDEREGRVGVLLDQSNNGIDVLGLVAGGVTGSKLTVRGLGCAVTPGKVIDDETQDVSAGDIGDGGLDLGDIGDGVAVDEVSIQHMCSGIDKRVDLLTSTGKCRHQQPSQQQRPGSCPSSWPRRR